MTKRNAFFSGFMAMAAIMAVWFAGALPGSPRAASDLSGAWVYLGSGFASIEHYGDKVFMELTWTSSDLPGPHYRVEAILSPENVLTGGWRHLTAQPESALMRGGHFEAKVSADGDTITVRNTQDNGHNWNSIVLTRVPGAGQ